MGQDALLLMFKLLPQMFNLLKLNQYACPKVKYSPFGIKLFHPACKSRDGLPLQIGQKARDLPAISKI